MAQFQVPQFIETESKIIGPLTIRQFIYIGVAGLLSFFLFFILKIFFWAVATILLGLIAMAFAFIKYNGRPLATVLKSAFIYYWNPRLYLWKREEAAAQMPIIPKISAAPETPVSKLKNLWVGLLTKKPAGPGMGAAPSAPIVRPLREGKVGGGGPQVLRGMIKKKD